MGLKEHLNIAYHSPEKVLQFRKDSDDFSILFQFTDTCNNINILYKKNGLAAFHYLQSCILFPADNCGYSCNWLIETKSYLVVQWESVHRNWEIGEAISLWPFYFWNILGEVWWILDLYFLQKGLVIFLDKEVSRFSSDVSKNIVNIRVQK